MGREVKSNSSTSTPRACGSAMKFREKTPLLFYGQIFRTHAIKVKYHIEIHWIRRLSIDYLFGDRNLMAHWLSIFLSRDMYWQPYAWYRETGHPIPVESRKPTGLKIAPVRYCGLHLSDVDWAIKSANKGAWFPRELSPKSFRSLLDTPCIYPYIRNKTLNYDGSSYHRDCRSVLSVRGPKLSQEERLITIIYARLKLSRSSNKKLNGWIWENIHEN